MTANVEKMTRAKGTNKSWHGEENQTDIDSQEFSLEQWAKNAGLDWTASKRNLFIQGVNGEDDSGFVKVNGSIGVVRDSDNRLLGIHSDEYQIVQPRDTIEALDDIISVDGRFRWDTAGSLDGGRKVWALARFDDGNDFQVLGEAHKPYLLASTSFDGSLATLLAATLTRVVCANTLRMSLNSKQTAQVTLKHRTEFTAEVKAGMQKQLQETIKGFAQYQKLAEALHQVQIGKDAALAFLHETIFKRELETVKDAGDNDVQVWTKPSTRAQGLMDKLTAAYEKTVDEGGDKATAWTVANALTRYADHDMGSRLTEKKKAEGETAESVKFESVTFGAADSFKQSGLQKLLTLANVDAKQLLAA